MIVCLYSYINNLILGTVEKSIPNLMKKNWVSLCCLEIEGEIIGDQLVPLLGEILALFPACFFMMIIIKSCGGNYTIFKQYDLFNEFLLFMGEIIH